MNTLYKLRSLLIHNYDMSHSEIIKLIEQLDDAYVGDLNVDGTDVDFNVTIGNDSFTVSGYEPRGIHLVKVHTSVIFQQIYKSRMSNAIMNTLKMIFYIDGSPHIRGAFSRRCLEPFYF